VSTDVEKLPEVDCTDVQPLDGTAKLGNFFGTYQCALDGVPNAKNVKLCTCPTKVVKSGAYTCTLVGSCGARCQK
jgi:hypothetical protein